MQQNPDCGTDGENDHNRQDGNRPGCAAIETTTTTGQKRNNITTDPLRPTKRTKVEQFTLEIRERVLCNVLESDSVDAFMSRPRKDRVALYKAKLLSPAWLSMLFDHELDDYPLIPETRYLWDHEVGFALDNKTLMNEARKVFWGMNAFEAGGFWLGELLHLRGARKSIARVRVKIDAQAEPEDWTYEYKSLKKLIWECPQLDWVAIQVDGRAQGRWNSSGLVEQRTAEIIKFLKRGPPPGRREPKRGVHLIKWIGHNTYQTVFGENWFESGAAKEEARMDGAQRKLNRQRIAEGEFPELLDHFSDEDEDEDEDKDEDEIAISQAQE
ncbi:hypothetical protein KCU89_g2252, partial [Aureobasidium melanogenum]